MQPRMRTLHAVMEATIAEYRERLKNPDKYKLVKTGLEDLDEMLGGGLPNPEDAVVMGIGGQWKRGKTALAVQISTLMSMKTGKKVGLFALEELNSQTALRVFSRHIVGLHRSKFYSMTYTDKDLLDMEELAKAFVDANFWVTDDIFTPDEILKTARDMGLEWIVVDNLNLVEEKGENETRKLTSAMRKFIHARNKSKLSVIIVYQLNEEGKALDSRGVYRGADMFVQLEEELDTITQKPIEGMVRVTMPRGRRTGIGDCKLGFNGDDSRFSNLIRLDLNAPEFLDYRRDDDEEPPDEDTDPILEGEPGEEPV